MAEQSVPAVQLGKAIGLDVLYRRLGEGLPAALGSLSEVIVLQPDWACPASIPQGYTIELSTRGTTRTSFFLTLVIEPRPAQYGFIAFSENQVNGYAGGGGRGDWGPNDWVRWSINIMGHEVSYRAAQHARLLDPYFGRNRLDVRPPYTVRAIIIGATDLAALSVAEVRMWDGYLCETLEDQLEFLGGRRLDGRESRLLVLRLRNDWLFANG